MPDVTAHAPIVFRGIRKPRQGLTGFDSRGFQPVRAGHNLTEGRGREKSRLKPYMKGGGKVAARLTDKRKKKIIADYVELGSYNAVAKKNNVCDGTVKRIVESCGEIQEKLEAKKQQNDADILAYMESQRGLVCQIIQKGLDALNSPDKLKEATPAQITTALGTLIDKFTMARNLAEKTEDSGVIMMPEIGGDEAAKP